MAGHLSDVLFPNVTHKSWTGETAGDQTKDRGIFWHLSRRFIYISIAITFICILPICLIYQGYSDGGMTSFCAVDITSRITCGWIVFLISVNTCRRPVEACGGQPADKKRHHVLTKMLKISAEMKYLFSSVSVIIIDTWYSDYNPPIKTQIIIILIVYGSVVIISECKNRQSIGCAEIITMMIMLAINCLPNPNCKATPLDMRAIKFIIIFMVKIVSQANVIKFCVDLICILDWQSTHPKQPSGDPPHDPRDDTPKCQPKVHIGVCSSAVPKNTQGFVNELRGRFIEQTQFAADVTYIALPYSKLDEFNLETELDKFGIDILILCHSIENRRFSLTNVTDALYNNFIPRASKKVGKAAFIVIAHDFPWAADNEDTRSAHIETLKIKQPTTHQHAGTVLLAGKLERAGNVAVCDRDWVKLKEVLEECAKSKGNKEKSC